MFAVHCLDARAAIKMEPVLSANLDFGMILDLVAPATILVKLVMELEALVAILVSYPSL